MTEYSYSDLDSISIDWGDGTAPSTDFSGTHIYNSPGIYTVTITVENAEGDTGISYTMFSVGLSGEVTGATIDWGDGGQSVGLSGAYEYSSPGTYSVVLTAENDIGETHDHYFAMYIGGEDAGYYLDFGDGSNTTQPNNVHLYQYPGEYTWVLREGDETGTILDSGTVSIEAGEFKIEVQFFTLTGLQGTGGVTGLLAVRGSLLDGANGIFLDPTDGPALEYGTDYTISHAGSTGIILFDLPGSNIRDVLLNKNNGETSPLVLRAVYNSWY